MPSESSSPDLIFFNARVITLNGHRPTAELVAVKGDRIVRVGSNGELGNLARSHTRVIDCQGQTLVPGFIDAHCHLMAYASSLMAVDCSSSAVASIEKITGALREGARHAPPGQWVRAYGYDDFALSEQRPPLSEGPGRGRCRPSCKAEPPLGPRLRSQQRGAGAGWHHRQHAGPCWWRDRAGPRHRTADWPANGDGRLSRRPDSTSR